MGKYDAALKEYRKHASYRVDTEPVPEGQKYPPGMRVKIADEMPPWMSHFERGKLATVEHTYAHAYGGEDVKSYRLNIDGIGSRAWYDESQLEAI